MMDKEDDDNDPWLDQFLAGQERKAARANSTGWTLVIAFGLLVVLLVLLAAH